MSQMLERVRLDTPAPLEDQICGHVRRAFARGVLVAGERLPSARAWARDLGVHWNTVARAYRRLGAEGLLEVRRGSGVVVARAERPAAAPERSRNAIREKLGEILVEARLAGFSQAQVRQMLVEEARSFRPRQR
jgi:DNA-binding transcriptional regulator YhcF (GntR family)